MAIKSNKLGLIGLMAIVFGVITGGGFYNITQNMAYSASLGASMVGWAVTGFGMLFLVMTFKILSDRVPTLDSGIYQYALEGGGKFVGFIVAWGYWLCAAMGNVAFAVLLNDSIGYFFPVLLKHGWESVLLCSTLIWSMYGVVSLGVATASLINTMITIIKFASIGFIIVLLIIFFKSELLLTNVWGDVNSIGTPTHQINSTILVTLWCFIGVESAVMLSQRAKNSKNVGVATVIGFLVALGVYAIVTMLSYGIMGQAQLGALKDPSVGYMLSSVVGTWGVVFVAICTILAVIGGWIAWSMVCAQVPFTASKLGIFPRIFSRESDKGTPTFSLLVSSIIMQLFIFVVITASHVYLAAIQITSIMVMPAYLFTPIYLLILIYRGQLAYKSLSQKYIYITVSVIATLFCVWMMTSSNLTLHLLTSIFYVVGFGIYFIARRENRRRGEHYLKRWEWLLAAIIVSISLYSMINLAGGGVKF